MEKITFCKKNDLKHLIPNRIEISEAYPNPFNPSTLFTINSNKSLNLKLLIYNIQGQLMNEIKSKTINQGLNKIKRYS